MITNQISGETREAVNEEGIGQVSSIEELIQMCDNLNQVSIDAQEHEVVANGDLKKVTKNDDYSIKVTFLELYNEEITDLLSPEDNSRPTDEKQKKPITLMEDGKGSVFVRGLEEESVYF